MNDWIVSPRSAKEIAALAANWRDCLGFAHHFVPNIAGIIEIEIPKIREDYEFNVVEDDKLLNAKGERVYASTSFDPLGITFSSSQYMQLVGGVPHARFTGAHELGHLFLHASDKNLHRSTNSIGKYSSKQLSAEWQASEFAAAFLIPELIARQFDDPNELAANTMVSLRVAQIQLAKFGLWPKRKMVPDLSFLDKYRTN